MLLLYLAKVFPQKRIPLLTLKPLGHGEHKKNTFHFTLLFY